MHSIVRRLWLWYLLPSNPILIRVVFGASRRTRHLWLRFGYLAAIAGVVLIGLTSSMSRQNTSLAELAKTDRVSCTGDSGNIGRQTRQARVREQREGDRLAGEHRNTQQLVAVRHAHRVQTSGEPLHEAAVECTATRDHELVRYPWHMALQGARDGLHHIGRQRGGQVGGLETTQHGPVGIEEDGAVMRKFEPPLLFLEGPGECALLVPEQL